MILPIIFSILTVIIFNTDLKGYMRNNYELFSQRIGSKFENISSDQDLRLFYHAFLPQAILYNGIKTITGSGFGTSSFPFVSSGEISKHKGDYVFYPYDPESTYISYLFDIGLFGLILYLIILYKNYFWYSKVIFSKKYKETNVTFINVFMFCVLVSICFSGLFYHYTLTAYQVLSLVFLSVLMDKQNFLIKKQLVQ